MKAKTVNRLRRVIRRLPPRVGEAITWTFSSTFTSPFVQMPLYQKVRCGTCGHAFYIYKEQDPADWPDCLYDDCASYDARRDPFGVVDGPNGPTLLDS